jgi:tRNA(fMet)-specific endonuclease VapC
MVRAELVYGALRSKDPRRAKRAVERFLAPYAVVSFDAEAADHYADIRFRLEASGSPIGPNDLVIAATARAQGLVLVTHNTAEFGRVPGLQIEDWGAEPGEAAPALAKPGEGAGEGPDPRHA